MLEITDVTQMYPYIIMFKNITCVSMQTIHSSSSLNVADGNSDLGGADGENSISGGADGIGKLFNVFINISWSSGLFTPI